MTERKKLGAADLSQEDGLPDIDKKGRGWEISEKRLDKLHDRARELRRFPTEAHTALAERFAKADLGRYKFTRHMVVGSAIVDFACHNLGMAVAIDEEGSDPTIERRRDKSLEAVGIRVMRVKASDVLEDIEEVLTRITAGMRSRIGDKSQARREHFAANPNQTSGAERR